MFVEEYLNRFKDALGERCLIWHEKLLCIAKQTWKAFYEVVTKYLDEKFVVGTAACDEWLDTFVGAAKYVGSIAGGPSGDHADGVQVEDLGTRTGISGATAPDVATTAAPISGVSTSGLGLGMENNFVGSSLQAVGPPYGINSADILRSGLGYGSQNITVEQKTNSILVLNCLKPDYKGADTANFELTDKHMKNTAVILGWDLRSNLAERTGGKPIASYRVFHEWKKKRGLAAGGKT